MLGRYFAGTIERPAATCFAITHIRLALSLLLSTYQNRALSANFKDFRSGSLIDREFIGSLITLWRLTQATPVIASGSLSTARAVLALGLGSNTSAPWGQTHTHSTQLLQDHATRAPRTGQKRVRYNWERVGPWCWGLCSAPLDAVPPRRGILSEMSWVYGFGLLGPRLLARSVACWCSSWSQVSQLGPGVCARPCPPRSLAYMRAGPKSRTGWGAVYLYPVRLISVR